jgi:integrase/recombinase XerD
MEWQEIQQKIELEMLKKEINSEQTRKQYLILCQKFHQWTTQQKISLEKLKENNIYTFIMQQEQKYSKENNKNRYTVSAINNYLASIKHLLRAFNYTTDFINALKIKRLPKHEAIAFDYTTIQNIENQPIKSFKTGKERNTLLQLRDSLIIDFAFMTGARCNEIVNVRLQDYDTSKLEVKIMKGKGDKTRTVPISKQWIEKYTPYFNARPSNNYLFCTNSGKQMSKRTVAWIVETKVKLMNDKKLEKFSTHKLRSSHATAMIDAGTPIQIVSENLGHDNLDTTKVYVRSNLALRKKHGTPLDLKNS